MTTTPIQPLSWYEQKQRIGRVKKVAREKALLVRDIFIYTADMRGVPLPDLNLTVAWRAGEHDENLLSAAEAITAIVESVECYDGPDLDAQVREALADLKAITIEITED